MQKRLLKLILLLSGCIPLNAYAETISGTCSVYSAPFGASLFHVVPGTKIESGPVKKGWSNVILEVFVERRYVYDGQKLLANARLKNHKGKLMGRTHVEFTPLETVSESDSGYVMRLAGYIEAICIEDTSIVEHELEKIFFSNTHSLADRTEFAKHFNEFNYQKWITKGSFDSYLLKDVIAGNTQNGVRALVIFENDKAIAVVYGRNIRIKKYEMHVSAPNYNLYILKSGNESYKKAISDTFFRELDTLY